MAKKPSIFERGLNAISNALGITSGKSVTSKDPQNFTAALLKNREERLVRAMRRHMPDKVAAHGGKTNRQIIDSLQGAFKDMIEQDLIAKQAMNKKMPKNGSRSEFYEALIAGSGSGSLAQKKEGG